MLVISLLSALLITCSLGSPRAGESRHLTYVALGASDSVGIGAQAPEKDGWVPVFHSQLPPGSRLVNLGVSGSLLRQAVDQQLPVALAAQPDLVTVWLAVNDFNAQVPLDRYTADLDHLLAALSETGALILVGNLPDVSLLPASQAPHGSLQPAIRDWNLQIASVVERHSAVLVDLTSTWVELQEHPEYIAADGFHPSTAGYKRLASLFQSALLNSEAGRVR